MSLKPAQNAGFLSVDVISKSINKSSIIFSPAAGLQGGGGKPPHPDWGGARR